MFYPNLFAEQQELQRQRDYDPVRLTIVGGFLVVLALVVYYGLAHLRSGDLRRSVEQKRGQLKSLETELQSLGTGVDLVRLKEQDMALMERVQRRVLVASLLDLFREIIPTNCQITALQIKRDMRIVEAAGRGKHGPIPVKSLMPQADLELAVCTEAATKVDLLQVRDSLMELLQREPKLRGVLIQAADRNGTNPVNDVTNIAYEFQKPKDGPNMIGIFHYRMPLDLKETPRQM